MMLDAPFHGALAEGPEGARAFWLETADNLRVRVAHYPGPADAAGTVLLFPGRTEYVEKYGRVAKDLAGHGYHTLTIDWRGQGLADRMHTDPRAGHVTLFRDYQFDVDAMVAAARDLDLPQPFYLLAHSMGGCIALRSLVRGLDVRAAAFTGPMWGIRMAVPLRPAAWALGWGSARIGMGHVYAPTTGPESYVASAPFAGNLLTTDRDGWDYMRRQVVEVPELQLGGPSLRWVHQALAECATLARIPSPDVPGIAFVGENERIVDVPRIMRRMAAWPGGKLEIVGGGEHEVLMDGPPARRRVIAAMTAFFAAAGSPQGAAADRPSRSGLVCPAH
ncbi:hydrolase [Salipiger aestuarii]|uniref:Lysophospholipase n=1 Tax=Salipiger aestuarii TaxID=568098 RepID=A0A327YBD1_9RHOB|nr:alpha/beta hydrolase [Salipiger aestuarii]KAB2541942.1 hydrolase [Salipiger aestuarii]RAK18134.1 lysophospholipase [Salipiger aestuarii]